MKKDFRNMSNEELKRELKTLLENENLNQETKTLVSTMMGCKVKNAVVAVLEEVYENLNKK